MPNEENSPLLLSSSSSASSSKNGLLPPLRQPASSAYGVIEVEHRFDRSSSRERLQSNRPKQGGIATVPFVAIIAVGIALGLIFGFTTILQKEDIQGGNNVLKQSEPTSPSYTDLTTPQGELRGYHRKSRQGRDYTAFYKVPYAAPPLGNLRFRDPQSPQPWEGLRDIKEVAMQCIQKEKYSDVDMTRGEEDCLYGNIYVPGLSPSEHTSNPLPTMVYIHGGGFVDGNGSRYGAEYFMDEDVVLVTFQFRLGPFGFLNTEDGVIRGNMGLKDQVQMLRWVRDNIQYYGGDPESVTIFGNSGGGISVSYLMLSPMSDGLFHRAITQSGGGICGTVGGQMNISPRITVEEVGRVLDCPTDDSQRFLECLETKDATDIALVRTPQTIYGITVERTNDSGVFMPRKPYEMLEVGWVNKVPYIVGIVNGEWTEQTLDVLYNDTAVAELNRDFSGTAGDILYLNMTGDELTEMRSVYFGSREISNDTLKEFVFLMSDRGMIHCSYAGAKFHSQHSPTYLYHLTKPPYKSYVDKVYHGFPAKEFGIVSHADELQYFFLYDGYPEIVATDQEYFDYSAYLVKLWAHFARTGNPTMDGITWDPMDTEPGSPFWFELGDKKGRTSALQDRMAFWDKISPESLSYV